MPDEEHRSITETIKAKTERPQSVDESAARSPGQLGGTGLKETQADRQAISRDRLTDEAAALTYHGVLAVFP